MFQAQRAFKSVKGLSNFTPNGLKSATLRVTTVRLCTLAVAAIMASSYSLSDWRCMSLAH